MPDFGSVARGSRQPVIFNVCVNCPEGAKPRFCDELLDEPAFAYRADLLACDTRHPLEPVHDEWWTTGDRLEGQSAVETQNGIGEGPQWL